MNLKIEINIIVLLLFLLTIFYPWTVSKFYYFTLSSLNVILCFCFHISQNYLIYHLSVRIGNIQIIRKITLLENTIEPNIFFIFAGNKYILQIFSVILAENWIICIIIRNIKYISETCTDGEKISLISENVTYSLSRDGVDMRRTFFMHV